MNDQILPPQGQSQSLFDSLVGEGKRFSDKEVFAQAKVNSDEYIKTLELKLDTVNAENKNLRETTNSQAGMQELIDQYKQLQQAQSTNPPQQPPADNQPKTPTIDLNQIKSMVHQIDAEKQEKLNLDLVQNKIKEKWGENIPPSVRQQVDKLGDLGKTMAKLYPDEFLKTIGVTEAQRQPNFQTPPRSNAMPEAFKSMDNQERTWSWWEQLRKKDPNTYASKKMTMLMHNDIQRMGDKFMDGDFGMEDRDLLRTKYTSF